MKLFGLTKCSCSIASYSEVVIVAETTGIIFQLLAPQMREKHFGEPSERRDQRFPGLFVVAIGPGRRPPGR